MESLSVAFRSGEERAPASKAVELDVDAYAALNAINTYRAAKALRPLKLDAHLIVAASALAADMAERDQLSHIGPGKADLSKRLKTAGYHYLMAAENVGVGHRSFIDLMERWKANPAQSQNILLPEAKQMGIAYEYRPGTRFKTFWALVVASQ